MMPDEEVLSLRGDGVCGGVNLGYSFPPGLTFFIENQSSLLA